MSTATFYHPELTISDQSVSLSLREASHALKARRMRVGQAINLINGHGLKAQCVIAQVDRNNVVVTIESCQLFDQPNRRLTIAVAIPKGDRQRTMVDMLTQLGVTKIIPLKCEHSVTVYKDNLLDKWQRVAIEACKQSQNPWLPIIESSQNVGQLLAMLDNNIQIQACYTDAQGQVLSNLELGAGQETLIMIGPEGGFSESEIADFITAKLYSIKLSDAILRTETAAVSAAAQLFTC